MSMTIKQFEAFRLVLAHGTTSYAAEKLDLTQSAVSRVITQLEQEVGFLLFDRRQGRLHITPEGQRLYSLVEKILTGVDQINALSEDESRFDSASLNVGTMSSLGMSIMPRAVQAIRERFQNLRVTIDVAGRSQLEDATMQGEHDMALVTLPIENRALTVEPLSEVECTCILPIGHPLAEKPFISPHDLEDEQFISMEPGTWIRYRTDEMFSVLGINRKLQIETGSMILMCSLVADGLGVSLVHRFVAEQFSDNLVIKPFRPRFGFEFGIILPSGAHRTLITQHFIHCIKDTFKDLRRAYDQATDADIQAITTVPRPVAIWRDR